MGTRLGRGARFAIVGLSGLVVNQAVFMAIVAAGAHYLVAAIVATQVSSTWNFALSERWVFAGDHRWPGRFVRFLAMNNAAFLLRGPLLVLLVAGIGLSEPLANLFSLGVLTVARFLISDAWIWRPDEGAATAARASTAPLG